MIFMAKLIDITGKALSGEWGLDDDNGSGIPVLRTTNFTNEGIVNYDNVVTRKISKKNINEKFLKKGDILIEKSGGSDKFPVGRVIYYDGENDKYLFNNFTGLLRIKNVKTWYPKYVFYSLFANYKRGGTRCFENKTTGLHNLKTDDYVQRYEIAELSIEKQIRICDNLDKIHSVIISQKKELGYLDELVKARFVEMFGEIGRDDKGWGITTLSECCEFNPKRPKSIDNNLTVSFIPMSGVSEDGKIDCSELRTYRDVRKGFTYFVNDDVLFAKITPCMENGKGAVVRDLENGIGVGSTEFHVLRPIPNRSNSYWLYAVTKFESFRDSAKKMMTGTGGQLRVSVDYLKSCPISLPPIELQNHFEEIVIQITKSKAVIEKSLKELETLQASLMQKYFS